MRENRAWGRRRLLQGLALGAASLGRGRIGQAQPSIPKRVVVIAGDGMIYDDWRPVGLGGAAPTETEWDFGEVHRPLAPYKSHVLYVEGLGMVSEEVDPGPKGNAHQQGAKHALAAANTTNPRYPGGPTIDQVIAQKLSSPSPVTKFPSLQFAIVDWANDLSSAIASAANTPLELMWDPRPAYERIFRDFRPPAGSDPGPSMADVARDQQLAVLGFARGEFSRLSGRLGAADRSRLESHLSLLSDLEGRMKLVGGTRAGATCSPPQPPPALTRCHYLCFQEAAMKRELYGLCEQNNLPMIAAALACDLTRVVSLQIGSYGESTYHLYGYTPGQFGTTGMHDLIHKVCDRNNPLSRDPQARKIVKDQNLLEAKTVAALLKLLDQIPEADGKSLLHHTVVLWGGHIGYGSHDLANLPWALVGSAGGFFRTGRYVKLPANPASRRGHPHNDLLLSVAQAAGTPIATIGNASLCTGPIAALRA